MKDECSGSCWGEPICLSEWIIGYEYITIELANDRFVKMGTCCPSSLKQSSNRDVVSCMDLILIYFYHSK